MGESFGTTLAFFLWVWTIRALYRIARRRFSKMWCSTGGSNFRFESRPDFSGFSSWIIEIRLMWCGGWDLNPRTPTGQGPEPCAFDLSWQPPRERETGICFDKCLSYFASLQLKGRGLYPSFENPRPYPGHRRHFCQMGN